MTGIFLEPQILDISEKLIFFLKKRKIWKVFLNQIHIQKDGDA